MKLEEHKASGRGYWSKSLRSPMCWLANIWQKCAKIFCRSLRTNVRGSCDIIAEVTRSKGLAISLPSISSAGADNSRLVVSVTPIAYLATKHPAWKREKSQSLRLPWAPKVDSLCPATITFLPPLQFSRFTAAGIRRDHTPMHPHIYIYV